MSDRRAALRRVERLAPGDNIVLAWLSSGQMANGFMDSVCSTLLADQSPKRILNYIEMVSSPRICEVRTQIVEHFLDHTEGQWLVMVDADMTFDNGAVVRLVDSAVDEGVLVAGGLCFALGGDYGLRPTLYRVTDAATMDIEVILDYPTDARVKVDATGAAFLAVHRRVLTEMHQKWGRLANGTPNPYPWFAEGGASKKTGAAYGEDIMFCLRARGLGYDVMVDTSIKIGHIKTQVLTEDLYLRARKEKA